MYEPGTILVAKNPKGEDYAFDRVRVIGPSPIHHGQASMGEWVGSDGSGVLVEPLSAFSANIDEPFGKLQAMYDIESVPAEQVLEVKPVTVLRPGPSPEEFFAAEAAKEPKRAPKK
jgi:hypothetical protein